MAAKEFCRQRKQAPTYAANKRQSPVCERLAAAASGSAQRFTVAPAGALAASNNSVFQWRRARSEAGAPSLEFFTLAIERAINALGFLALLLHLLIINIAPHTKSRGDKSFAVRVWAPTLSVQICPSELSVLSFVDGRTWPGRVRARANAAQGSTWERANLSSRSLSFLGLCCCLWSPAAARRPLAGADEDASDSGSSLALAQLLSMLL